MGKIIRGIENSINLFNKIKEKTKDEEIILFGTDDTSDIAYEKLIKLGIGAEYILRIDIDSIGALEFKNRKYDAIVCNRNPKESFELLENNKNINEIYLYDLLGRDHYELDYNDIIENESSFEEVYDMLYDKKSKEVFLEFINAKISGDYSKLVDLETYGQYVEKEILDLKKYDSICDCGSYDGADILKFKEAAKKQDLKVISLEPDMENYTNIIKKINDRNLDNVVVYNIGAWDKKEKLSFSSNNGTSSCISTEGKDTIKVDCIDNLLDGEKCDYLKMDIEGAELNALRGAKETILRNKSDLAICIYHKKEDLYKIPLFIKKMGINYKYSIRLYNKFALELVFYAIKE